MPFVVPKHIHAQKKTHAGKNSSKQQRNMELCVITYHNISSSGSHIDYCISHAAYQCCVYDTPKLEFAHALEKHIGTSGVMEQLLPKWKLTQNGAANTMHHTTIGYNWHENHW